VVIFTHNIYAEQWDYNTVVWYITRFWKQGFVCREDIEMPLFLNFLNLLYPESDYQGRIERFVWSRFKKKQIAHDLIQLQAACETEKCRVMIFEELAGITQEHVSQWLARFGQGLLKKDEMDLIYGLFKNRATVCMAEIEKELITIIEKYQRAQSGLHSPQTGEQ
jgi:hypothetical protein